MTASDGGPATRGERSELDEALDRGAMERLPDNVPPGMLGEVAPDLRARDDFTPGLNAGILQESSHETRLLATILFAALGLTAPVALWLLWTSQRLSRAQRWLGTALIAAWVAVLVWGVRWS